MLKRENLKKFTVSSLIYNVIKCANSEGVWIFFQATCNKTKIDANNRQMQVLLPIFIQQWESFSGRWLHLHWERQATQFTDRKSTLHHIVCGWDSKCPETQHEKCNKKQIIIITTLKAVCSHQTTHIWELLSPEPHYFKETSDMWNWKSINQRHCFNN